jgi:hypothetical protein
MIASSCPVQSSRPVARIDNIACGALIVVMRFLRRLFGGRPKLMHPVFGPVLFFDFGAKGSYWEAEREVEGRTVAVIIEGDETGPTDDQVEFYRMAIADLDALFRRVVGIIEPEYASWVGASLPERWRDAARRQGHRAVGCVVRLPERSRRPHVHRHVRARTPCDGHDRRLGAA